VLLVHLLKNRWNRYGIKLQTTNYKSQIKNHKQNSKHPAISRHIFICLIFFLSQNVFSQSSTNPYPGLAGYDSAETIQSRFPPAEGFQRVAVSPQSFAHWLRNLPLLPEGTPVKDYRGQIKVAPQDTILAAVVDYNIRGKKLEQCMDIILRFWAEYLFSQQRSDEIAFYLPVNFLLKWSDWQQGFRPHHQGIQISLLKNHAPDSSRDCFQKYLWEIFYYSNTQTAYFNYPTIKFENVQIGDFIVKRGSRGHAVLIVDLAVDSNGNRIALFGQGDTPARQFYLLNYKEGQPWFPLNPDEKYPLLPIRKKMYWEGLRRLAGFFVKPK
jgi:hypothetical protein